jgi:hypothetical protein
LICWLPHSSEYTLTVLRLASSSLGLTTNKLGANYARFSNLSVPLLRGRES